MMSQNKRAGLTALCQPRRPLRNYFFGPAEKYANAAWACCRAKARNSGGAMMSACGPNSSSQRVSYSKQLT